MEQPSDLELFLKDQSDDGLVTDTSETFTISRERALEKLASFQMPFDGAWSLKLVQCAVAGKAEAITVHLRRKDTEVLIKGMSAFTLDEVEDALFDGSYFAEGPLLYLVTALRALAFNQKRAIWLSLPGESQALVWDGKQMKRVVKESRDRNRRCFVLTVSSSSEEDERGLFGFSAARSGSKRNAAAVQVLANMAHVCPIPLTVDCRRLDAFELNPNHGWSATSQILILGFEDCDLPSLPMPAATLERAHRVEVQVNSELKTASEGLQAVQPGRTTYSLAYLLSAHMERVKQGKSYVWKEREGQSLCYWVRHGVVIQSEVYNVEPDTCSVGCFISAEGLQTDLTGFGLKHDSEKAFRFDTSRKVLREGLAKSHELDFDKMVKDAESSAKTFGAIGIVVGAGLTALSPIHGIFFLGLGAWTLFTGGAESRHRQESYNQAFRKLRRDL